MSEAPPPVFTIGNREEYSNGIIDTRKKGQVLLKLGQAMAGHQALSQYFPGGIIFQNPRDARKYIDEEWPEATRSTMAVFEVKGSWEHDCYSPGKEMYWRYLMFNRPITLLVTEEETGD